MKWYQWTSLSVLIVVTGCSAKHTPQVSSQQSSINSSRPDEKAKAQPTETPFAYPVVKSLRVIDFRNFAYEGFIVRDGKFGEWNNGLTLEKITFGDVTGDGKEEAIISFRIDTDGSMGVSRVFIFTLEKRTPKVILDWESGDRAQGGLRAMFAKAGKLWVETYGVGTNLDNDDSSEFTGLCCPRHFTRTHYKWHDGDFQPDGNAEIVPVPRT